MATKAQINKIVKSKVKTIDFSKVIIFAHDDVIWQEVFEETQDFDIANEVVDAIFEPLISKWYKDKDNFQKLQNALDENGICVMAYENLPDGYTEGIADYWERLYSATIDSAELFITEYKGKPLDDILKENNLTR